MKTLLGGCSLSDWCGFGDPLARDNLPPVAKIGNHDDPRCWYNIVKEKFNLNLTNVSYGGYSNEEILSQIVKKLDLDSYQLVIIQLTATHRKWFYRSDNPFEFVLAHGENSQNKHEKQVFEYLRISFNNELIEIERTLGLLCLIQNYLEQKNIPMILINGINFGSRLKLLINDPEKFCRQQMNQTVGDDQVKKYAQELLLLASKIKFENFLFLDKSLKDLQIDMADDQQHPGKKSNLVYADVISKKLDAII